MVPIMRAGCDTPSAAHHFGPPTRTPPVARQGRDGLFPPLFPRLMVCPTPSRVIILDEPTAGVDVELRRQLWELVTDLNDQGVTVVLTTHYLEEAEELCDRIAIINHGELIAEKPTRELVGMAREKVVSITVDKDLGGPIMEEAFTKAEVIEPRRLEITYDRDKASAGQVLALVQSHGYAIEDVTTREADLEDVFVQLTGAGGYKPLHKGAGPQASILYPLKFPVMWLDLFHRCLAITAAPYLLACCALYIRAIYAVLSDSAGNTSQSHLRPSASLVIFPYRFVP